jgi:kynurenine formamidase
LCLAGTTSALQHHHHDAPRVSRRRLLATGLGVAAAATLPAAPAWAGRPAAPPAGRPSRTADLTHVFRAGFPVYTGSSPTRRTTVDFPTDGYYAQEWTFAEHSGTHVDAPGHFAQGGPLSPDLPPGQLIVPAVVIDIADRAATNPDAQVTVADLMAFERRHGRIPRGAAVLMDSGWAARAHDHASFGNADAGGTYHFPGFSAEAVEALLNDRDIAAIGVDTMSLDFGPSTDFAVHFLLLGAGRYGIECLRGLEAIPRRNATIFVGLVPWEEGSGGPCRVLATW